MKRKIFAVLIAVFGVLSIAFSSIISKSELTVYADTDCAISIGDKTIECPAHLYIGTYDCQQETAYICETSFTYINREKIEIIPYYYVDDEESFEYFNELASRYVYLIEQDAYYSFGSDALSNTFILVCSSEYDFEPGEELAGNTISSIKSSYPFVSDVIVPDTFDLEARLVDSVEPIFEEYSAIYITDVDNPATVDEIKASLVATDDVDGDVTDRIIVSEDNYTEATKDANETYTVKFKVTDLSENSTEITIHVKVQDVTAPVIEGPLELESYTTDPITVASMTMAFSVTDNCDRRAELNIFSDKYTPKKDIPGDYEVVFYSKDASGNISYYTTVVHVLDKDKPTISGPASYTKSTTAFLSTSVIMSNLVANDKTEGNISNLITVKLDEFSGHESEVGTYNLIFTVQDRSNNKSEEFLVTVTVKDTVLPVFYVDDTLINITDYEKMNHEQIIEFLKDAKGITKNIKRSQFLADTYTNNYDQEGTYNVSVKLTYDDESSEVMNVKLKVHKHNENEQVVEQVEEVTKTNRLSFFERIAQFFQNLTKKAENLFSTLWTWLKNLFR